MKRIFLFLFVFSQTLWCEPLQISVGAESAILINAKNGAILFEKQAHLEHFPASTTKIATALYALHLCQNDLGKKMIATPEALASITPQAKKQSNYRSPPHWLETDGSHIGIKNGEEFKFSDLLYAMLLSSANDASNVVAHNLGGTIPQFMADLNLFLCEIGCKETNFNNPHGLQHPEHVTTAYDLAIMARKAMESSLFREIVGSVRYEIPKTNLELERTLVQTNHLLRSGRSNYYPKAIGIKTGTTTAAGKNLVAAAESNNRSLIAVLLGYKGERDELYRDATKLFEAAFNEKKLRRVYLQPGCQEITARVRGGKNGLKTCLPDGLYFEFYPSEEITAKASIAWEKLKAPVMKGSKVATVRIKDQRGEVLQEKMLLAYETVDATLFYRLFSGKNKAVLFCLSGGGSADYDLVF